MMNQLFGMELAALLIGHDPGGAYSGKERGRLLGEITRRSVGGVCPCSTSDRQVVVLD